MISRIREYVQKKVKEKETLQANEIKKIDNLDEKLNRVRKYFENNYAPL